MLSQFLFFLMLAFFITHEMDAARRREWQILPLISLPPDAVGERVFMCLHVPLFLGSRYILSVYI